MSVAPAPERIGTEPAFLRRIRLRAHRRVLWLRHVWAAGSGEEPASAHAEADRLLGDPAWLAATDAAFAASEPLAAELDVLVRETDEAAAADPRWQQLQSRLGLADRDVDLLSLAVAAEVRPEWTRLYAYLQDEPEPSLPTAALAAQIFGWPPAAAVGAGSGLVGWALARTVDGGAAPASAAAWVADPQAVAWLTGAPAAEVPLEADAVPEACLYPDELAAMSSLVGEAWIRGRVPLELELVGPRGSGRAVLAAQLARSVGLRLVVAEGRLLAEPEPAVRALRTARLEDAALYWRDPEEVKPEVWSALSGRLDLTFVGTREPTPRVAAGAALTASFRLPPLDRAARAALWRELSDAPAPSAVERFLLTPAEIERGARTGATERSAVEIQPGELLTPLPCPYGWDDIVLPAHLLRHLREFEQQARWRWEVYEDWGFERLVPLGRGLSALFAGPSGTGKTMASQVLARSLGLDLYRIDLAGVVNKYIGETEKRLKRVFDACERAGAILLFDEADALFGRRSQVKDAHDRYANIEIDYLLQRMEQFDGIAILATNRKEDLDRAFMRRLRFVIDFLRPGPAERLAIWRLALPQRTPAGESLLDAGVDHELLAARLQLTGAEIKAAALGAAFLARSESRRIRMDDVIAAARRELAKQGAELRAGGWE